MDNRTYVGLDVHKETSAVAVLRPGTTRPDHRVIPTTPEAYRKLCRTLKGRGVLYCYEAGPCGFDPYRMLTSFGAACDVIAPTLIPRRSGRRVKTDRIDAQNLARLHRAGELTTVRVPSADQEAVRDLIRVREDFKADRRRAIQRLKSFLLRYGCRYPKAHNGWSHPYENWVCALGLEQPRAQEALDHLIATVQTRHGRLAALDLRIAELVGSWSKRPGTTSTDPRSVWRFVHGRRRCLPPWWRTRGKRSCVCAPSSASSQRPNRARWRSPPWLVSLRGSFGVS